MFLLNDNCASYEQLVSESGISSLHLCRVRASAVEVYKEEEEFVYYSDVRT